MNFGEIFKPSLSLFARKAKIFLNRLVNLTFNGEIVFFSGLIWIM